MGMDLIYSVWEGVILLIGLLALMYFLVWLGLQRTTADPLAEEFEAEIPTDIPTRTAVFWLVIGLIVLPLSSKFLVEGALNIAMSIGISDTVIGLTLVAFGTSLPELATAVTSALRREDDLAIGNIIGSNMFNMLGVLGIAAVIHPVDVAPMVLARDYPIMFLLTGLLYLIASDFRGPGKMGRQSGAAFLVIFIGYQLMVWFSADAMVNPATG